jgi:hypothetical protein
LFIYPSGKFLNLSGVGDSADEFTFFSKRGIDVTVHQNEEFCMSDVHCTWVLLQMVVIPNLTLSYLLKTKILLWINSSIKMIYGNITVYLVLYHPPYSNLHLTSFLA